MLGVAGLQGVLRPFWRRRLGSVFFDLDIPVWEGERRTGTRRKCVQPVRGRAMLRPASTAAAHTVTTSLAPLRVAGHLQNYHNAGYCYCFTQPVPPDIHALLDNTSRKSILAFAMGKHKRLGAQSPIHRLPRTIIGCVTACVGRPRVYRHCCEALTVPGTSPREFCLAVTSARL